MFIDFITSIVKKVILSFFSKHRFVEPIYNRNVGHTEAETHKIELERKRQYITADDIYT